MVSGRAPHSERPALLLAGATHGVAEPSDNGGGRFFHEGWGREGGAMGRGCVCADGSLYARKEEALTCA